MKVSSFLLKLFLICIIFYFLLVLDGVLGVHVFFVGGVFTMMLLASSEQVVIWSGFVGFFYDVRFHFPLGTTFLVMIPLTFLFPVFSRFFHSRMVAFCIEFILGSTILLFLDKLLTLQLSEVIWNLMGGVVWTTGVYLYLLRSKHAELFQSHRSRLRFS